MIKHEYYQTREQLNPHGIQSRNLNTNCNYFSIDVLFSISRTAIVDSTFFPIMYIDGVAIFPDQGFLSFDRHISGKFQYESGIRSPNMFYSNQIELVTDNTTFPLLTSPVKSIDASGQASYVSVSITRGYFKMISQ